MTLRIVLALLMISTIVAVDLNKDGKDERSLVFKTTMILAQMIVEARKKEPRVAVKQAHEAILLRQIQFHLKKPDLTAREKEIFNRYAWRHKIVMN
jgi:hypothetical protein